MKLVVDFHNAREDRRPKPAFFDTSPGGPAQPLLTLGPAGPTTLDDLVLQVEAEGDYRVEWFTNQQPTWVDGETVAALYTTRGESWGVRVTPLAGGREGEGMEISQAVREGSWDSVPEDAFAVPASSQALVE